MTSAAVTPRPRPATTGAANERERVPWLERDMTARLLTRCIEVLEVIGRVAHRHANLELVLAILVVHVVRKGKHPVRREGGLESGQKPNPTQATRTQHPSRSQP